MAARGLLIDDPIERDLLAGGSSPRLRPKGLLGEGLKRIENAGKDRKGKPGSLQRNLAYMQDALTGFGGVAGAPINAAVNAVAEPVMRGVMGVLDRVPSPDNLLTFKGRPGEKPRMLGDAARQSARRMGELVDAGSDALGYDRELGRELAMTGAGLLAPAAGRGFGRVADAAESAAGRLGYTFAPDEAVMYAGGGPRSREPSGLMSLDSIGPGAISEVTPGTKSPLYGGRLTNYVPVSPSVASREAVPHEYNISLMTDYPGFRRFKDMRPDEAMDGMIGQMASNLVHIVGRMEPEFINASMNWYPDGANFKARDISAKYGVPEEAAAGALARLSPKTDWDVNAEQADRLADMRTNRRDQRIDSSMLDLAESKYSPGNLENARRIARSGSDLDSLLRDGLFADAAVISDLYDRTYGSPQYRTLMPWGEYGDIADRKFSQNSLINQALGLGILENPSRENISRLLGESEAHKIRGFHNLIAYANAMRERGVRGFPTVVGDTHQVAANTYLPLSNKAPEVSHNFSSSLSPADQPAGYRAAKSSKKTGIGGTYPYQSEAVRRASQILGWDNPYQVQSVTWSGIREAFKDLKKRKGGVDEARRVWQDYDDGLMSLPEAQNEIARLSGGPIRTPDSIMARAARNRRSP